MLALFLGGSNDDNGKPDTTPTPTSSVLPPITVAAPSPISGIDAPCTKVLAQLPITLDSLPGRPARSTSTYVAAWGEPPIVLRCGVARPTALVPGSSDQIFSANADTPGGVYWLPLKTKTATVWTTVDRAVYVEVTVPSAYPTPPLNVLGTAIAKALPAVCLVDANAEPAKLCTHRS